jgi:3-oxoacyl-(acyl-carrier-protein) synthase
LGEGAGVMVLEEYEHAKKRGAKIYAELGGYGLSADAGHMTAPNMDGPRRAMLSALRNASVNADQVDYLNAHGTSTPLGDINETNAIKAALGDHAKKTVVNSTKSMTGHLLGGAGGIESVFTALAIYHQKSPPKQLRIWRHQRRVSFQTRLRLSPCTTPHRFPIRWGVVFFSVGFLLAWSYSRQRCCWHGCCTKA